MGKITPKSTQKPVKVLKNSHELAAWQAHQVVLGVDEVGRGCLAGPVVTAAVILHPQKTSRLVKDSKLLTKPELAKAFTWIIQNSWYGIGIVNHTDIDHFNIYQATIRAMKRAIIQTITSCPHIPAAFLIDALPIRLHFSGYEHIPVHNFPKGESWSSSIAAASIVAKVTRDQLMDRLDTIIPGYHLATHKGYATPLHRQAVKHHGKSLIHRVSFLNNFEQEALNHDHANQTHLFNTENQNG